ncbi:hypothetical protein HJ120_23230 [Vibrio parahaemolyticus]|nr:hypothetical protein [Vibrio parahaemolyticus]RFD36317.1 hypothetical protein BS585_20980 [Vibrio parahaemolyticus]
MDASGLLTVIAVLLTGAALLPRRVILDLVIRMTIIDWIIVFILSVSSLYLLFLDVLINNNMALPFSWLFGFDKESSLLLVSIVAILYAILKINGSRISRKNFRKLNLTTSQLLKDNNFKDVSFFVDKYYFQLRRYCLYKSVFVRFGNLIEPKSELIIFEFRQNEKSRIEIKINELRSKVSNFFPKTYWLSNEVKEYFLYLYKSRSYMHHLAIANPVLGVKILTKDFCSESMYRHEFFKFLISNSVSPLYRELALCQCITTTDCYELDPTNVLLTELFSDVSVAHDMEVYQSIYDYVSDFIELTGKDNSYNVPHINYYDTDKAFSCPIYMSIHFFDVMIRASVEQAYEHHLYPNKIFLFVKNIVEQLDYSLVDDIDCEFPTRYDRLIYESFSVTSSWLEMVKDRMKQTLKYDSYLIIESYALMLNEVLASDKFNEDKKSYYLSIVLRTMREFDKEGCFSQCEYISHIVLARYQYGVKDEKLERIVKGLRHNISRDDFELSAMIDKYF